MPGVLRILALALLVFAAAVQDVASQDARPTSTPESGYARRVWNTESGLPINEVWGIQRTPDGYLWLATFAGLVRFDGRRFVVYSSAAYPALPSDRIEELVLRRDGSLLLRTELGHLVAFDGSRFTPLIPGSVSEGLVTALWRDETGDLWLAIDGRDFGRLDGNRFRPAMENPPGWNVVKSLVEASARWVATRDGKVFAIGPSGVSDETPDRGDGLPPWTEIHDLARGPDGRLYLATPEGLFRLPQRGGRADRITASGVSDFSVSPADSALVGHSADAVRIGSDGIPRPVIGDRRGPALPVRWDNDGALWHVAGTTLHRNGVPLTEVAGLVHDIFVDMDGSAWLATQGGLVQVTPNVFTSHQPSPAELRAACREMVCVPTFAVYALAEQADSSLLIGTLDFGTWVLGRNGELRQVSPVPAFSLLVGDEESWMGTFGGGVCRVGPDDCVRPPGTEDAGSAVIRAVARSSDGSVWLGANQEVLRIDQGRVTRFGVAHGLPAAQVSAVIPTPDGGAWIGTFGGLARILGGKAEVLGEEAGLSSQVIRSMRLDDDGVLWVGTEGRGLNRVAFEGPSLSDATVTTYSKQNGLFADGIHTILDDGAGRLWMSSNDGIFWVRRAELEAYARGETTQVHSVAYLERDGLANREANGGTQSAGIRTSDGRLWFATMGGAAVVDPADIGARSRPLSVIIESASSEGVAHSLEDVVVLGAERRNLQVEYTAPILRGAESLRFRYRMEGYDADWVEVGTRRTAFYTNLPPGELTFRVSAAGPDGTWYEAPVPLRIAVTPLFYERGWFFPFAALLGAGVVLILAARRHAGLQAQARALSHLVAERTSLLEREKEESEQARRAAEAAEARVKDALGVVAAQAQRLKELDEAKSRLFANISHELRTPLTLTIGPLEDLREELSGRVEADTLRGVDIALSNSRRILRLVNQLLDVAKLEYGKLEIRPTTFDLAELMRVVAEAFAPLAQRRGIRLETRGLDQSMHATLDGDAIEKILLNLLANAFKACEAEATVVLGLERVQDSVRILVQDEGTGIEPEKLPHIFDRFYHGASGSGSEVPGTGIGLALVRELVELHGGSVRVASKMGVGTSFTIDLPFAAPLELQDQPSRQPRPKPDLSGFDDGPPPSIPSGDDEEETHPATVLLVDDNQDIRAYVRKHLADRYRVLEAEDGAQALAIAKEDPPDLVLADVMMPVMDGEELCRRIKGDPDLEFVPVVLLTAKASPESRRRALELGADDHLSKPFDKAELRIRIANLIARSRRLRDRLRRGQDLPRAVGDDNASPDQRFLSEVRGVVLQHLDDEEFGVDQLAAALGVTRADLYRRLDELHHQSPAELIKALRLQRAAELLRGREGTVNEVAYAVGFRSVSHFSRSFREAYGDSPMGFARAHARET